MWAVAGFLLGIVVLASVLGFHVGPHGHLAAGVVGILAAAWLLAMASSGRATALLWVVLGADLAVSAGVGALAWKGLRSLHAPPALERSRIEGRLGVAESALAPDGVVRVRGESWSATSLNGDLPAGARVQVIAAEGVRLEVWGEAVTPDDEKG